MYNKSGAILLLDAYIEDIELPQSELVDSDALAFTASQWLHFDLEGLEIPAGGDAFITITADVPAGTPTGGYHAFGYLQSRPQPGPSGIQPSARIGVTVLLEVAPENTNLDRTVRVSDSDLRVRWNNPFDPEVVARTVVDNIGDTYVVTGGVHTFRSWPGSSSFEAKIGPNTTLRSARHTFESSWDAVPLFGKVTVTSELVYQSGPDTLPVIITQHTVWIIPWHLLIAALVVLVLTVFIFRRRKAAKQTPSKKEDHDEQPTRNEKQDV